MEVAKSKNLTSSIQYKEEIKINEIRVNQFLLKREKQIGKLLMIFGGLLIFNGLFIDFSWLNNIGNKHLNCYLPVYLSLVFLIKPYLIITGSFLSFILLFKNQIIKLYEKNKFKSETVLVLFLILIFCILGFIAYFPFHNYPLCMDEYGYLYQAKIFSQGKLFIKVPEIFEPFRETHMILKDDKLFTKFPLGFPLVLTIGVLLNTTGLINPLIATITLVILYCFVRSFLGRKYGLLSVILMSTTPYFLGYSASYYSQPTALLMTTLIFFLVRKYEMTSKDIYLPLIGLSAGYLFLTRPLDSVCVIFPSYLYLAYILYKEKNVKKMSYPIFTFTIVFLLSLICNYILIGKFSIAAYDAFEHDFPIVYQDIVYQDTGGLFQSLITRFKDYIASGFDNIPVLLLRYLLIPSAVFIPLFAIYGFSKFKSKWKWVLLLHFLMLIFLYNIQNTTGWPQYGARYYYSGFISLVIPATIAFKHLIETLKNKKLIFYFLTLVLCTHCVFSLIAVKEYYSNRFKISMAINEDIRNNYPEDSIVILNSEAVEKTVKPVPFVSLGHAKRNPFMNTSRLITKNNRRLDLDQIKLHFPNHSIYYYDFGILDDFE